MEDATQVEVHQQKSKNGPECMSLIYNNGGNKWLILQKINLGCMILSRWFEIHA